MMRSQAIRNAMAPAVIAMAVIFGLEMLLVQPLRGELATARAELDSARSEIARMAPGIERAPREQARLEAL
ncbi:MAG: hypothetical protein VYC34_11435, partial [Planctomycetota bacterium]|nr:hypothetical protein [Planctomycetota bacterium]